MAEQYHVYFPLSRWPVQVQHVYITLTYNAN